jgi:ABC-2 type transport system ATP-binding protein
MTSTSIDSTAGSTAPGVGGGVPGAAPSVAVSIRGLVKRYGENTAVDGLDLDIHTGEVFALLGPNGAGKTTTVEILEGFRRRDSGTVNVLGHDPADDEQALKQRLGIVLQTSNEQAELSVEEMVRHFAHYYPDPRDPDEVIVATGLDAKRTARTRALSGGQRRRLDVALGIIGRPDLLFLDEPTTGFDPEARRAFWQLIRDLRGDGTTILLTTHYLDEAEALADRVGVITRGRLVALDTPTRLGGRDAHRTVVSWLENGPDGAPQPRSETTATPTALVGELAARFEGEVPGLQVRRPSLEDVYLDLIDTTTDGETR